MERRFAGKRAKLTGELFERLVEASCRHYRETGQAVIEKTPEPMKPLSGMDRQGRFQACFTKAAQPDYKGVLARGQGGSVRGEAYGRGNHCLWPPDGNADGLHGGVL